MLQTDSADGSVVGAMVGSVVGAMVGLMVGAMVVFIVGETNGGIPTPVSGTGNSLTVRYREVHISVGAIVGEVVGWIVGLKDGGSVG